MRSYSKLHVVMQSLEIVVLVRNTFAEKLKSEPKATEERNACLTVMSQKLLCDKKRLPLCSSRQTIRSSKPGIWKAIQRTYSYWTVGLLVFKFIKSKEKFDGCARKRTIMIFLYWLQKIGRIITARLACQNDPGHLFVVKFYGRVNTIKVMSNLSVSLLGSQRRSNKCIFLNTRFQYRRIYN